MKLRVESEEVVELCVGRAAWGSKYAYEVPNDIARAVLDAYSVTRNAEQALLRYLLDSGQCTSDSEVIIDHLELYPEKARDL